MRAVSFCCAATVVLGASCANSAQEFTLVRDGAPACTIVISAQATRSAQFAAAELWHHVKLITGAELPILTDEHKIAGPRILVGESKATVGFGLRGSDFADQEYLVRIAPQTLVLIGCDEQGPDKAESTDPGWIDGRFGKALSFNGKNQGSRVGDCGFEDAEGSLECWVRLSEATQPREGTILRLDGGGPWTYHILRRMENTDRVGYFTYDGEQVRAIVSEELAPGWHHLLATHSLSQGKAMLYVDGVKVGESQFVKSTCEGSALHVGGIAGDVVGNPLHGHIDEVRVSNVVRDPAFATGGPYEKDAATTLLLHLDEGSGPVRTGIGFAGGIQPPGFFDANGTLYAAYDLLERSCGVRWYAPGDIGTVYDKTSTLTVSGDELRRKPAMRHRWITPGPTYLPGPPDTVPAGEADLWKLRMRIGGESFWTCHSFSGYYDRFLQDHPDWFAQGYEGRPPQPCFTNEGFVAQLIQDAEDYFDGKGSQPGSANRGPYFGIVPEDNNSFCKCPTCQALMDEADRSNQQFSRGVASDYVWGLVNTVAKAVGKDRPDRWVAALAYADYAYYPRNVELEDNIAVQMCLHTRNWWAPKLAENDQMIFDTWVEKSGGKRPLYLWLYYNFPAFMDPVSHFKVFPGFFVHTAIQQMAMYHQAGIKGIFMEHSCEFGQSFLHDQLDMYVTLRLADDPNLDGEALVEEFFTRYYGAAAEPMKQLYLDIEQTYSDPKNYPPDVQTEDKHCHQSEEMAWKWLGTAERMERFAGYMARAHEAARTDIEKQRVQMFDEGIWQYMLQGRKDYVDKHGEP